MANSIVEGEVEDAVVTDVLAIQCEDKEQLKESDNKYCNDEINNNTTYTNQGITDTNQETKPEITDAKQEIEQKRTDTNQEISNANHEINDTNQEVADTNQEIEQEITDTNREIEQEITDTNQEIDDTNQKAADTNQEINYSQPISDQVLKAFATVQLGPSLGLSLINDIDDTSSDTSSDSDQEIIDTMVINNCEQEEEEEYVHSNNKYGYPMTLNEVDYRDLPLTTDEYTLSSLALIIPIGTVRHTTEELTIIESLPNTRPVGEGTIFWSKERNYLGMLFETLGPVKTPFYSIRVGRDHPEPSSLLSPGTEVFVAIDDPQLTQYVFTDELLKDKGSDASWKNDHEVPLEFQDVSDDELERDMKREKERERGRGKVVRGGRNRPPVKSNNNTRVVPKSSQNFSIQNSFSSPSFCPLPPSPFPPPFPPPPYSLHPPPPFSSPPSSLIPPFIPPPPFLPPSILPPPSLPPLPPPPPFPPAPRNSQCFHHNNNNQW